MKEKLSAWTVCISEWRDAGAFMAAREGSLAVYWLTPQQWEDIQLLENRALLCTLNAKSLKDTKCIHKGLALCCFGKVSFSFFQMAKWLLLWESSTNRGVHSFHLPKPGSACFPTEYIWTPTAYFLFLLDHFEMFFKWLLQSLRFSFSFYLPRSLETLQNYGCVITKP